MVGISGWNSTLPTIRIKQSGGAQVGWLLGYPIDVSERRILTDEVCLSEEQLTRANEFEDWLYDLGGRFAAVLLSENVRRLYVDASASLTCIYSTKHPIISATTTPMADDDSHTDSIIRACRDNIQSSGTWFPLGFTKYSNLWVLLPNHYLDLSTWVVERHWPRETIQYGPPDPKINRIVNLLGASIEAVQKSFPIAMNLTAGRDSRMLLACARPWITNIEFETLPDYSPSDVTIGRLYAEAFGLTHLVKPSGNRERVLLQGFAGEVGRSFYWRKGDTDSVAISARELFARMNFQSYNPVLLAKLESWISELRGFGRFTILDLLYIEHRLGCCMGPVMYREDERYVFSLYPLNHRDIFGAMLSLPPDFRMRQKLFVAICNKVWPELTLFPVNAENFVGWDKYLTGAKILLRYRTDRRLEKVIMRLAKRETTWKND